MISLAAPIFVDHRMGIINVPAARIDVWEMVSCDNGWLYGVQATGHNGSEGFAGMVWNHDRLHDGQIAPVAVNTSAGTLAELAAWLLSRAKPPMSRLAELALFKLAVRHTGWRSSSPNAHVYISALRDRLRLRNSSKIVVKRSLSTFRPGEEKRRPIAVDAQSKFENWEETVAFCRRHPNLVWLEDPLPLNLWHTDPVCAVPLVTGEHVASVVGVETILHFAQFMDVIAHLELSQLGPVGMAACIEVASQRKVPLMFHGHLPFDTALVLGHLGVGGLIELNVTHLGERAPWPYATSLLGRSIISGRITVTDGILASILSATVPAQAKRRT
jgi:hypothetical protein